MIYLSYFLVLIGVFFLLRAFSKVNSRNFQTIRGRIIKSLLTDTTISSSSGMLLKTYIVKLKYEYPVDKNSYIGENIYKNEKYYSSTDPQKAKEFFENHKESKEVLILVNESDPKDSYLLDSTLNILFLILGGGCITVGLIFSVIK